MLKQWISEENSGWISRSIFWNNSWEIAEEDSRNIFEGIPYRSCGGIPRNLLKEMHGQECMLKRYLKISFEDLLWNHSETMLINT